jgi:hypothetical protein
MYSKAWSLLYKYCFQLLEMQQCLEESSLLTIRNVTIKKELTVSSKLFNEFESLELTVQTFLSIVRNATAEEKKISNFKPDLSYIGNPYLKFRN